MIQQTDLARLGLFDARVPRYTSYPTAPHFSDDVGPERHARWISAVPEGARISLYVHVPFCRRLCWFCACRTQGTRTLAPLAGYMQVLRQELAMLAKTLPTGVALSRLHFGGGTPTMLSAEMLAELCNAIFAVAPVAEGGEFSVEIDPNEVDSGRVAALTAAGMTRASIGVQDFDPEIQKIIGREQSFEVTRDVIAQLRDAGVQSLNADILFGLPNQSRARIAASVEKLLSLSPDRVALYGYAHVPWMARRQTMIPTDTLPAPQERLALFETARRLFLWDGYDEIGIDHFARPADGLAVAQRNGRLRRNFQGYTDDTAEVLIGVGASSISRFPQGYTQNAPATSAHAGAIGAGQFSTARGHVFTADDRARARIIEMLMCEFGVDAGKIDLPHAQLQAMFDAANARFEGQLIVDGSGLRIPPHMRPLTRMVAREFDRYEMQAVSHSSAI
ncbi:oxygen-independent coproporphyrinogen III oxidase [Arenibacterium halophilum]|uniref:Coproporphyrinogen-III oxidase n=1 Tax=Arenibacterium halophilum TaxID=2583821 RepID=A0ABY2X7M9_9RHOB|nr:oxygen-independent coproporphyrinogen III oxidase [Arenibacterium halophilum]TMV11796.1 oxygen-independent coproporphyrinogen III oxidase [Arenibacterium halophilum]